MIKKSSACRMHSNLSDHQLKIGSYKHSLLYMNLTITIILKPIIDTQKIKKKEPKNR